MRLRLRLNRLQEVRLGPDGRIEVSDPQVEMAAHGILVGPEQMKPQGDPAKGDWVARADSEGTERETR